MTRSSQCVFGTHPIDGYRRSGRWGGWNKERHNCNSDKTTASGGNTDKRQARTHKKNVYKQSQHPSGCPGGGAQ